MTNANVEQTVTGVDGQTLTLKYKDGEKKIIVPPDAPIVAFAPGDKGDLKPGVKLEIQFQGPVNESFPVQATAGKIVIVPGR